MTRFRRFAWALVQLVVGFFALGHAAFTRRGGTLVFTHFQDLDDAGQDHQMGPLIDALIERKERVIEVTLIPLSGALFENKALKGRPCIPYAIFLAPARVLSGFRGDRARLLHARAKIASWIFRLLRPRIVYVIDESGSAQGLVRAAKARGIPTIGIQHGDFRPGNRQYDPDPKAPFLVSPADCLCLWSSWFRDRLFTLSPIYHVENTAVVGRMRCASAAPSPALTTGLLRVLVLGEADAEIHRWLTEFTAPLALERDMRLEMRVHPRERTTALSPAARGNREQNVSGRSLALDLAEADVVIGHESSALLEAIYARRPVICVATPEHPDRAGFIAGRAALPCDDPNALARLVRQLAASPDLERLQAVRDQIWGHPAANAAQVILAVGDSLSGGSKAKTR